MKSMVVTVKPVIFLRACECATDVGKQTPYAKKKDLRGCISEFFSDNIANILTMMFLLLIEEQKYE